MSQLVFTKHARERMNLRSISESAVHSVLDQPDFTQPGNKDGAVKFIRTLNGRQIQVVANYLKDQYKWLVISVWVRGEDDPQNFGWTVISAPFKLAWWVVKQLIGKK